MKSQIRSSPYAHAVCTIAAAMALGAAAQVRAEDAAPNQAGPGATAGAKAAKVSPYRQQRVGGKAMQYYSAAWGIDGLKASYTSSGNLIRFSYRVSNPERAKPLGDKRTTPSMYAPKAHAVLQVPVMDKVGILRQSSATPQAGQEFWMVFSNKGNLVRPGDRVNVTIGAFHADGLMVE